MLDVFVIGAGCSVPYGFPTGAMLMQQLKNFDYRTERKESHDYSAPQYFIDLYQNLFGSYERYKMLKNSKGGNPFAFGGLNSQIAQKVQVVAVPFAQSIRHSMMVSTDEFLKNRLNQEKAEEADFGKRLIAREILIAERKCEKQYFYEKNERQTKKYWLGNIDWIQHLLSRIDQQSNWEEILKQTVFLTFNYDRVLEHCIFLYLTSDKQYDVAAAHSFIKEMQIFHVNGFIGSLESVPFGEVENGKYQEIAKGMETVWEKRKNRDESEKEKYQEFLKKAERVYFLGFSYIPDNLDSIGISRGAEIIHDAKIYATAMGLSPQNRLRISSYLNIKDYEKRFDIEPPEVKIEPHPFDSAITFNRKKKDAEQHAKDWVKRRKAYYENRILKDASAMDLILDYYTFG